MDQETGIIVGLVSIFLVIFSVIREWQKSSTVKRIISDANKRLDLENKIFLKKLL